MTYLWRNHNPTNEPDTCLWCGQKLRHKAISEKREGEFRYVKTGMEAKGGDYVDGFFCGLRCGYQFGVQMAEWGRRIKKDA